MALTDSGIEAFIANENCSPVQFARELEPNLILLDARLAEADDYWLCRELQLGSETWHAPVMLITEPGSLPEDVSSLECGAIDYLYRPVSVREAVARVRTHLRLQQALEILGERQAEHLRVLEVAQQSCMPRPSELPAARFHVALKQSQSAGGDFYDVIQKGRGEFVYVVADASGHDLSSSYWTLALKTLLFEYSDLVFSPPDCLSLINRALCRILPSGIYFTLACAHVNRTSGRVLMLNAGHPPAVIIRAHSEGIIIHQPSDVLGCFEDAAFARTELEVNPGDRIFLFSDGLADPQAKQGLIVDSLFRDLHNRQTLETVVDDIFSKRLQDQPVDDDVLLMGIEI